MPLSISIAMRCLCCRIHHSVWPQVGKLTIGHRSNCHMIQMVPIPAPHEAFIL
jgi:hypothetical protein